MKEENLEILLVYRICIWCSMGFYSPGNVPFVRFRKGKEYGVLSHFSRVWLFVTLWTIARLLLPWDSPSKNIGVGCHALLHGIFPTQRSNPCLLRFLHCRWFLYCWVTREASRNMAFLYEKEESYCDNGYILRLINFR